MILRPLVLCCAAIAASPAAAVTPALPQGAVPVLEMVSPSDSYALPVGPFDGTEIPRRIFEGRVERRTWRLPAGSATSLQILAPLRSEIQEGGFELLLDCADRECGGFDFRFGIEVAPAPDMHVNLRDFRFLSAVRGDEAISLLVSVSPTAAYVQQIRVTPTAPDG